MEFNVIKVEQPTINVNFDEVKAALTTKLEEYNGIVVTETTLPGCKQAQKELASLRNEVDGKRKEIKKSLSDPISHFEDQCKELIAMIEKVEKPIKEGIKVFDDQRREEKRSAAAAIIEEEAALAELNDKYKAMVQIKESYLNLTGTDKAVREDIAAQCMALRAQQDTESEKLMVVLSAIERENARLNQKLALDDFRFILNNGSLNDILSEISARAEKIYQAEHAPKDEPAKPAPEIKEEPKKEEAAANVARYYVKLEITGTFEEMRSFSSFLKDRKIEHKVLEQKEI